jgi:predicted nucleic acid-binding protein
MIVVDTDVVSELMQPVPSERVLVWLVVNHRDAGAGPETTSSSRCCC